MSAKKAIVLILLVVFTLQVAFPHPVLAVQGDHVAACSSGVNMTSIVQFLTTLALSGATVWGINEITSVLAGAEFDVGLLGTGITIKDVFEPLDQAADFVSEWWLKAVFFGLLGSLASVMSGFLIEAALDLNINLLNDNAIINAGYGTILGLANLGFVLAIIVIAFATMFRQSGWDAQSSLARLIIAALLVNFSLFFAGIIMGLGNGLMSAMLGTDCWGVGLANQFNIVTINSQVQTFLNSAAGIPPIGTAFTDAISGILGAIASVFASLLPGPPSPTIDPVVTLGTTLIGAVIGNMFLSVLSIFFASALTIIGALTLVGIFLFLIARYVALVILIIFMPIAWIGLIFPKLNLGTTNLWGAWWHNFLKWVFMGPLIVFFLYLTNIIITNLTITQVGGAFNGIAQLIVLVMFSLSSLWVANKMSIAGAQIMYGVASKAIDKGIAGAKNTATNIATAPLRSEAGQKISQAMARGKLNLLPGSKGLGRDFIVAGASSRAAAAGPAVKDMKGMTKEEKNAYKESLNPSSAGRAAVAAELAKTGDLMDPEKELNSRTRGAFMRQGMGKAYEDLEKFSHATEKSIAAIASENFEAATEELANMYSKTKGADFKKLIKFSDIFKKPLAEQEVHINALFKSKNTDAIGGAFQSLSYEDQKKFLGFKNGIPESQLSYEVKDYLENGPGKKIFSKATGKEDNPVDDLQRQVDDLKSKSEDS